MAWTARTWVTGETVTATKMNTLRDDLLRTSAATVTTAGDIAFADAANSMGTRLAIGSTDDVLVVAGAVPTWNTVPEHDHTIFAFDEVASVTTTSTEATYSTATFVIPAAWNSWRCWAVATFGYNTFGVGSQHALIRIDGTNSQDQNVDSFVDFITSQSVVGHRTGITTTGTRSAQLRSWHTNAGDGGLNDIALYAQAYRVS